jgi:predicted RNA-binding Zn-ribbon protein involved in translation (DUF1610 family)
MFIEAFHKFLKESNIVMQCKSSGEKMSVSDYDVMFKKTICPTCGKKVKVSFPDKKMHRNIAKLVKHSGEERECL